MNLLNRDCRALARVIQLGHLCGWLQVERLSQRVVVETRMADTSSGMGVHEHENLMAAGLQAEAYGDERVDVPRAPYCGNQDLH